jgi:hypothetical protein
MDPTLQEGAIAVDNPATRSSTVNQRRRHRLKKPAPASTEARSGRVAGSGVGVGGVVCTTEKAEAVVENQVF